ncbi:MAG: CBS domain-containing protein [Pseudomonadales bacterium]|nr:CBS domain-containing protein [Pseudomonadales bacterium]
MKKLPTIASTMSPFPYSIDSEATVAKAAEMMKEHDIHHLPVTEGSELVSVISKKEVRMVAAPFSSTADAGEILVKDVCTVRAFKVDIHDSLEYALTVMAERHIGSVLVTKNGKLSGILTHTDVCRKFSELLHQLKPNPDGTDAA